MSFCATLQASQAAPDGSLDDASQWSLVSDGSLTAASEEGAVAHPQASQEAPVGSPADAPGERPPQSSGSFLHAFMTDPGAAAAREMFFRCDSAAHAMMLVR